MDRALNDDDYPDEVDQRDAQVVAEAEAAPVRPGHGEGAAEGDPEQAAHRERLWDGSTAQSRVDEQIEPPD